MTRTIKHKFSYSHSPEVVWDYLTKSELIAQWLMPNDFQPIVGHEFSFRTKPMPAVAFDGIVCCKVLELVPCKKLSYTWKGGPGNGETNMDSVVTWVLEKKDSGTELFLEHTGFIENPDIFTMMNKGWLENITKINELIKIAKLDSTNA
jgi:uncharacterized protein YndB with AHSA1/START domain